MARISRSSGRASDLTALGAALGITSIPVRFSLTLTNNPTPVEVELPLSLAAFTQDFGQVVMTTTVNIPANAAGIARLRVTVDPNGTLPEDNESDNAATRTILVRTPPLDRTPPVVSLARLSDDDPFNENDPIVQSASLRLRINTTDPTGPEGTVSGVQSYCVVTYLYNFVTRRWEPVLCSFRPLPAPETGTTDSFLVNVSLTPIGGVAYAFVWTKDGAGNISRVPAFDVVTFVPSTPVTLNRNSVMILRLPLDAGQNLEVTADVEFGDVDVAVFDDFTNPAAARIALSANNGPVDESVIVGGPGRRQVEIRAVANSRFTIQIAPASQQAASAAAATQVTVPAELLAGEGISVAGPPACQTAIEEIEEIFLPVIDN